MVEVEFSGVVEAFGGELGALEEFGREEAGEDLAGKVAGGDEVGEEDERADIVEVIVEEGGMMPEDALLEERNEVPLMAELHANIAVVKSPDLLFVVEDGVEPVYGRPH